MSDIADARSYINFVVCCILGASWPKEAGENDYTVNLWWFVTHESSDHPET